MMRNRTFQSLAVLALVIAALTGCRTATGRTAGTYVDDATTTAKVKTALASTRIGTIGRVDVDSRNGVVYLTGSATSEESKQQILEAARGAADGKPVVDNLMVAGQTPPAAAHEHDQAPTAHDAGSQAAASPVTAAPFTNRFSRVESEPGGTDGTKRFVAFDKSGKQVATIYAIEARDLRQRGVADLDTSDRRIDHVSVYPHPGSDGMQYHVVLWHVDRQEAGAL
jgi:hyperosmotically inducible protein